MKQLTFILVLIIFLFVPHYSAMAQEDALPTESFFDTNEQLEALGIDEVINELPLESRDIMRETGLEEVNVNNILQLSPNEFFKTIINIGKDQVKMPIRTLGVIIGIIIIYAILCGFKETRSDSDLSRVFGVVAVLCMIAAVASSILNCISSTIGTIQDASVFMLGYIPVFSAALIASGQALTAGAYNTVLFAACQIVSQVVSQTLMPIMSIYLTLSIIGGINPQINIASICAASKKIVTTALGFITTMFVGLLSVQTLVSTSADSLGLRAGKFVISSFVPVVGGALSEAMLTAQGCLKLIKTSVGAIGIIIAVIIFLPTLINIFAWIAVTVIGGFIADITEAKEIASMLKSFSSVLSMMVSFLLCYALIIIVTMTVVMVTGQGGA